MPENPHFASASSWDAAREMLTFQPFEPAFTAGRGLLSLRIHIRDHKMRELPIEERSLEVHYGRTSSSRLPPRCMPRGPANHRRQGYGGPPKLHAKVEAGHYVLTALRST